MKKVLLRFSGLIASFAFFVAASSGASTASVWLFHEPKQPEALKKLK